VGDKKITQTVDNTQLIDRQPLPHTAKRSL
jgi:hypothetical protein